MRDFIVPQHVLKLSMKVFIVNYYYYNNNKHNLIHWDPSRHKSILLAYWSLALATAMTRRYFEVRSK